MYVFANCTTCVGFNGAIMRLRTGEAWYRDDPFVKARPELFAEAPPEPRGQAPVESATSSPGQKRNTRRG